LGKHNKKADSLAQSARESQESRERETDIADLITEIMPDVRELREVLARIVAGECTPNERPIQNHLQEIRFDLRTSFFQYANVDFDQDFVDLYTQIITYGLFMGWMRFQKDAPSTENKFTISTISQYLPADSLLQKIFTGIREQFVTGTYNLILGKLENCFNKFEYCELARRLGDLQNDFYSKFLTLYDPDTSKTLGVVYTNETIVNFTIRGIDHLLRKYFHKDEGILDLNVKYLDPAAGTMAYLCGLICQAFSLITSEVDNDKDTRGNEAEKRNRFKRWFQSAFLQRDQGFSNIFAFEVLMAPYLLGNLRVLMTAERFGAIVDYKIDRVQSYLLNTLSDIPRVKNLEEIIRLREKPNKLVETQSNLQARKNRGLIVVMGNPPYSVSSQNNSDWIIQLTDEYITPENLTREAGKPQIKGITGLKSMKDDYIKFLRFAQWQVAETNHQGIVALITNNFYLDGMVARGMRKELRRHFDAIYIVNLHGETRQRLPDRARQVGIRKDEGVFDITVGTAIAFLIHFPPNEHEMHKKENPLACNVFYCEKFGTRTQKYAFLDATALDGPPFVSVNEPLDYELSPFIVEDEIYNTFPYLCDIFVRNIQGIVTAHDTLVSNPDRVRLEQLIENFYENSYNNYSLHEYTGHKGERVPGHKYRDQEVKFNDSRDWLIADGLRGNAQDAKTCIIPWQFRGIDRRYLCYYSPLLNAGTERFALMQYLLPFQHNRALIVNKLSHKSESRWSNVFLTDVPSDGGCMEGASSGGASYTFPLRINQSTEPDDFARPKSAIHTNLNPAFMRHLPYWKWDELSEQEQLVAGECVFNYIYGVLYCPKYRFLYGPILAKDFPRVPFSQKKELFDKMERLGEQLASFHLMTNPATNNIWRHPINEDILTNMKNGRLSPLINVYAWIEEKAGKGKIWFDTSSILDSTKPIQAQKIIAPKAGAFYIDLVPKSVWTFEMGQIMQLDQWLGCRRFSPAPKKGRLSRGLTEEELNYFLKMINAIEDTIALYPKLDEVYQEISEGSIVSISRQHPRTGNAEVNRTLKKGFKPLESYVGKKCLKRSENLKEEG